MPDFFDRLIARGTQQPGGGMLSPGQSARPASGQPVHQAGRASDPSSGAAVTFALPRLPGPFEWLAADRPDVFLEAVDEVREADAARPETARVRPPLGSLAGTQAGITPPSLLRDSTSSWAPGSATTVPGEQPPARPAPAGQAPLLPRATPVYLVAEAGAAAPDQASARASQPAATRGQERDTPAGTASRPEHPIPPSPARTLAVPASAVRAARPAADEARTAHAQPPGPPPVTVRIGRIEVRNTSPDRREPKAKQRARRAAPKLTLAAYLAAANAGQNGGVSTGGTR
jgi:hypothetical protein